MIANKNREKLIQLCNQHDTFAIKLGNLLIHISETKPQWANDLWNLLFGRITRSLCPYITSPRIMHRTKSTTCNTISVSTMKKVYDNCMPNNNLLKFIGEPLMSEVVDKLSNYLDIASKYGQCTFIHSRMGPIKFIEKDDEPKPELAITKGIRVEFIEEPEPDYITNTGCIKDLPSFGF